MMATLYSATVRTLLTSVIAARSLQRNKMRSILTALGIIIGVSSVVAMIAVGNGAQNRIESQVSALGQNLLTIFAGNKRSSGVNAGLGSAGTLSLADAEALRREIPDIVAISPSVSATTQAIANGRNWSTTLDGESAEFLQIRDWKLSSGAMFRERDVRAAAKVAVIGSKTAMRLFGPLDPEGQTVRAAGIPFVIVGQLASKGAGMGGQDQDDRLLIPYTSAMKRVTGDTSLRSISVQISSDARMAAAQSQITSLLRQRHRLSVGQDDDFNVLNQKEIADTVNAISRVITAFLGTLAGMSLVVGGIGIMNIMLVSVTERTREIGVRISVGAKPYDILLQFLIEAVTLSLIGGILGIAVGVAVSRLAQFIAGFHAIISIDSIILAFCVSASIGVFFGFYPARKAAALDPIEALRFE